MVAISPDLGFYSNLRKSANLPLRLHSSEIQLDQEEVDEVRESLQLQPLGLLRYHRVELGGLSHQKKMKLCVMVMASHVSIDNGYTLQC